MFPDDMSIVHNCLHHNFNSLADDLGLSFVNSNETHGGLTHLVQDVTRSTYSSYLDIEFRQIETN